MVGLKPMKVQKYSQAPIGGAAAAAGGAGAGGGGIGGTATICIIVVVLTAVMGVAAVAVTLVIQSKTLPYILCCALRNLCYVAND